MNSWLDSDTFRAPYLVYTSKLVLFRLAKYAKQKQYAKQNGKYGNVSFG